MENVTLWCPLIPRVLLLPCRWCCAFPHCTKHLQNERLYSNPKLSMAIAGVQPFLALDPSMRPKGMSTEILDTAHLHRSSIYSSVSQTEEKARAVPQSSLVSWFFLRREIQNKWNWKGDSDPLASKQTTGTSYSFLQNQVCTLLELHKSSRGIDWQQKLPGEGWFCKYQQPTGRQHEAVVYCSQPWATLTELQHCSVLL